jgi:hypothetical protein
MPLVSVKRPALDPNSTLQADDRQQTLPDDTIELWGKLTVLPAERRKQFVQVATMWQASLLLWREHPTSSFALMVASCEALKPPGQQYRDRNIYHVTEALLGRAQADVLRAQWIRAHEVRSEHIHTGELHGSEFEPRAFMASYNDPSFRQATTVLWQTASAAIVGWLRRDGNCPMAIPGQGKKRRRLTRRVALTALVLSTGVVIGWVLNEILP